MITNSVVSTLRKEDGISARLGNPIRSAFPGAGLTSLVVQMLKNMLAMRETWVQSLGWDHLLEQGSIPLQYSCLENPHGQRSLLGYCPWGRRELDRTEQLSTTHSTAQA